MIRTQNLRFLRSIGLRGFRRSGLSGLILAILATAACGGIADPTQGSSTENVATVSGSLTGTTVPANARVALIYRRSVTNGATAIDVASDTAIVGGKFEMSLDVPQADDFLALDGNEVVNSGGPVTDPSTGVPSSGSGSGGGAPTKTSFGGAELTPRDLVSGGITEPLGAAVGGFLVYADTNGNGKLDLDGEDISSTDEVLGGNADLLLIYLKGGSSLDYEKMRDKSGIVPAAGFNLAWSEGRWLPLNEVELTLSSNGHLPSAVCDSAVMDTPSSGPSIPPPTLPSDGVDGGSGGYPSPTDPNLSCSADGRSFTYSGPSTPTPDCPPPSSAPVARNICSAGNVDEVGCAGSSLGGAYREALTADQPVPDGWPCPVPDADGGAADGGAADAGAADGG